MFTLSDKQKYLQVIDQQAGTFTWVSDKIWEYAELSLMEFQSAKLYCEVLEKEARHMLGKMRAPSAIKKKKAFLYWFVRLGLAACAGAGAMLLLSFYSVI